MASSSNQGRKFSNLLGLVQVLDSASSRLGDQFDQQRCIGLLFIGFGLQELASRLGIILVQP